MELYNITELIGQSTNTEHVKKILKKYNFTYVTKTHNHTSGNISEYKVLYHENISLDLDFYTIISVTIDPLLKNMQLPFDLHLKDTSNIIIKKIGCSPKSKGKSPTLKKNIDKYNYAWWFEKGTVKILTALNGKKELLWLRFIALSKQEIALSKIKTTIKPQKQKINLGANFFDFKKNTPTIQWRKEIAKNESFKISEPEEYTQDFLFSEELLEQTEVIDLLYFEKLTAACKKQSPIKIYNAVGWYIKQHNKLNKKHEYIETLEREVICLFIDKTIVHTGLELPKNLDITLEWRQW